MNGPIRANKPEEFDECGNAAGLEDGEQTLAVMGQVVQCTGRAASRLHVIGVAHRSHQGGDHLWRVHDGVTASLLLGQLVDHHGRLADHNLVLVVE